MTFYGLDTIIDELFAKENKCFPLRFNEGALVVAYSPNSSSKESIYHKCRERNINQVELVPYSENEIHRLIHGFYTIELKDKEIYRNIRNYIRENAFEKLFLYIVSFAKKLGASDIHIANESDYCFIKFRINGKIRTFCIIESQYLEFICRVIKVKGNTDIARTLKPVDSRIRTTIDGEPVDIRVAIINTIAGEKISLRLLNNENVPKSMADLGISDEEIHTIRTCLEKSAGTILVTGPTGSGKSTTVRCFLNEINMGTSHIITVEDPIEYQIDGVTQIQVEEKNTGFTQAVKSILRQDPDIIYIGEIRDEVSADVATKASVTGHLVFSTLHTKSASSAIERLEGLGIDKTLIVNSLLLIINQRLIANQCPACLEGFTYTGENIDELDLKQGELIYESIGCSSCNYSGIQKRSPLMSMIVFNDENKAKYLKETSLDTMDIHSILKNKFKNKEIALSEAKKYL